MFCGYCRQECEGTFVDEGIGYYEYGSVKGFHKDVRYVSECCESTIYEDEECTVLASPPEPDLDYPDLD